MPLVYQQNINEDTGLALWKIEETEAFFNGKMKLLPAISHPHKRLQHLAGRYLLNLLEADFPISLIQIADTRRPFLENDQYHFSISHCGNYAAALVSESHRVGVDIELISGKAYRLNDKFLSAVEHAKLSHAIANEEAACTCGWSIKEALFKWYALGKVDFKRNLEILSIEFSASAGTYKGLARVSKDRERLIHFEGRMLLGQCLSFVLSPY